MSPKHIFKVVKNDSKRIMSKLTLSKMTDKEYCYDTLTKVSRSFAMVIQDLPEDLKDAICVFYLVLRGLDTIEDDMNLNESYKRELLEDFHLRCSDENFSLQNVGDKPEYVELMENYPKIAATFNTLSIAYQEVIREITHDMAKGMLEFTTREVVSKEDYDLYCHYVAGLVGQGLSKIFVASELESDVYLNQMDISNSMGLFLQKTNITRDYYEDIDEGRLFWPKEIWGNYTEDITSLKSNNQSVKSIACLNAMVINAFLHFSDCIEYLNGLSNTKIFRFCAIPQVMAVGTLVALYNNEEALMQNVKVSKAETMQIFANLNDKKDFVKFTLKFLEKIHLKESDVTIEVIINQIKKDLNRLL